MTITLKLENDQVTTVLAILKTFQEAAPGSDYAASVGDLYEEIKGQQVEQMMQDLLDERQFRDFPDSQHDDHVDAVGFALSYPIPKRKGYRMKKQVWVTIAVGAALTAFAGFWHWATEPKPSATWKLEIENTKCVEFCVQDRLTREVFPDFNKITDECSRMINQQSCILRVKP